jgi:iron complex outermembrane receptor protein
VTGCAWGETLATVGRPAPHPLDRRRAHQRGRRRLACAPRDYDRQRLSTPWLAVAAQVAPKTTVYASWGQGVESEVAPNRARYTNRGRALPALKSRQIEAGLKHGTGGFEAAWHACSTSDRPQTSDMGACDAE